MLASGDVQKLVAKQLEEKKANIKGNSIQEISKTIVEPSLNEFKISNNIQSEIKRLNKELTNKKRDIEKLKIIEKMNNTLNQTKIQNQIKSQRRMSITIKRPFNGTIRTHLSSSKIKQSRRGIFAISSIDSIKSNSIRINTSSKTNMPTVKIGKIA